MMPPTRGPRMVRAAVAADHSPKARARASPWKLAVMSDRGPGTSRAPAAPCSSRKTMSHSIVGARPHSADVGPNADQADDEDAPAAVSVGQRAGEDEERGQRREVAAGDVRLALERARRAVAGRSAAMVGSATFTMVESRNTMPDARMTASRIQRACVPVTVGDGVDTRRMVRDQDADRTSAG